MIVDPYANRNPTWDQLPDFAKELPRRGQGDFPYSVRTHLLQRLGDSQLGNRPAVIARKRVLDDIQTEPITAVNYQHILGSFAAHPWVRLTNDAVSRFHGFLKGVAKKVAAPYAVPEDEFDADALVKIADVSKEVRQMSSVNFEQPLRTAWRTICDTVETGVLRVVSLPDAIHIVSSTDKHLDGLPAYYSAKEKAIYIGIVAGGGGGRYISEGQLRHEFGHHVEEQGPVEVWVGLASLLHDISEGKQLREARSNETREPGYYFDEGRLSEDGHRLPRVGYACSYYGDAGTELLALGLQDDVLSNLSDVYDYYDPDYILLIMQAFRPRTLQGFHEFVLPALR